MENDAAGSEAANKIAPIQRTMDDRLEGAVRDGMIDFNVIDQLR